MIKFLTNTTRRRIKLLLLLIRRNYWVTIEDICGTLACSRKTIRKDFDYIEQHHQESLKIEFDSAKGIRIKKKYNRSTRKIITGFFKESPTIQIIEDVFFHPNQKSAEIETKLFMTPSTLYRGMVLINEVLKEKEIEITKKHHRFQSNNELRVRYFFENFFLEVYGIDYWPFDVSRDQIFQIVELLNQDFELMLSDFLKAQLACSIAISIIREKQGYYISEEKAGEYNTVEKYDTYLKLTPYIQKLNQLLYAKTQISPEHYSDFYLSVFWWVYPWDNAQEYSRVQELAKSFIQEIGNHFDVACDEKSQTKISRLFEVIYIKRKVYPFRNRLDFYRRDVMCREIYRMFPRYAHFIERKLEAIEQKTKFPWHSLYLKPLLLGITIRWTGLFEVLDRKKPVVSVMIYSHVGPDHALFIANILKKYIDSKVEIVHQEKSVTNLLKMKVNNTHDIFVSNFPIEESGRGDVLYIEDIPSSSNIMALNQLIEQTREKKAKNRSCKEM